MWNSIQIISFKFILLVRADVCGLCLFSFVVSQIYQTWVTIKHIWNLLHTSSMVSINQMNLNCKSHLISTMWTKDKLILQGFIYY